MADAQQRAWNGFPGARERQDTMKNALAYRAKRRRLWREANPSLPLSDFNREFEREQRAEMMRVAMIPARALIRL